MLFQCLQMCRIGRRKNGRSAQRRRDEEHLRSAAGYARGCELLLWGSDPAVGGYPGEVAVAVRNRPHGTCGRDHQRRDRSQSRPGVGRGWSAWSGGDGFHQRVAGRLRAGGAFPPIRGSPQPSAGGGAEFCGRSAAHPSVQYVGGGGHSHFSAAAGRGMRDGLCLRLPRRRKSRGGDASE